MMQRDWVERETVRLRNASVAAVTGGTVSVTLDGQTLVGVAVHGAAPVVGARVLVLEQGHSLLVLPTANSAGSGHQVFATAKVSNTTTILALAFPALPYSTSLGVLISFMGGFSTVDATISVGVSQTGFSAFSNAVPSQGAPAAAALWTAMGGGVSGTIAANTAASVSFLSYTTAAEGAFWTGAASWTRT